MFYVVIASLLAAAVYSVDSLVKSRNSSCVTIFILVAAVSVLVSGLRAETVGTDTLVYGEPIYQEALNYPFEVYITLNHSFAPLFQVASWALAQISPTVSVFLGMIGFLVILPFALVIIMSDREVRWLITLYIMLLFFPASLNMMRQSIALGWVCLGIMLACKHRYAKMVYSLLTATLFHNSALLVLLIIPAVLLVGSKRKAVAPVVIGISIISIFGYLFYGELVDVLAFVAGSYVQYLGDGSGGYKGSTLLIEIALICLIKAHVKRMPAQKLGDRKTLTFLFLLLMFGLMINWMSVRAAYFYRVALYFISAVPFSAAFIYRNSAFIGNGAHFRSSEVQITATKALLVAMPILVSIVYYSILGMHEVVPYMLR